MNLSTVIERIRTVATSFSNRVAGAGEAEAALESSEIITLPHAFVVPLEESASGSAIDEQIGVLVAVSAASDDRGEGGAASLDSLRDEVFNALRGWAPSSSHRPMRYLGGSLFRSDRSRLFYLYEFGSILDLEPLIHFTLSLRVLIAPGSSAATVLTNWASAIETAISGISRLDSDHAAEDLAEGLAPGEAGYALKALGSVTQYPDSNNEIGDLVAIVSVFYRLGSFQSERDFTEGDLQTWTVALLDPDTWKVSGVKELEEGPSIEFPSDVGRA